MSFRILCEAREVEPDVQLECDGCHTVFWASPAPEENLVWSARWKTLVPLCPTCGRIDEAFGMRDQAGEPPKENT